MFVLDKDVEILTLDEAATFLRLSKRSVYRLLKDGSLPAKKVMHKWRFEREQLKEWVRNSSGFEGA
ncbi:MAG TPA: helix-turn-helix domain-containing protein [Candidatus Omnitrophota bacterium]|nr:helix-turn-helix domain-containing protein [Candidatus Omnitrophota bacterium]HRZ14147.1 helix-turn-helix domain-containing protein [Candidatus Omnitrophota bacterium]